MLHDSVMIHSETHRVRLIHLYSFQIIHNLKAHSTSRGSRVNRNHKSSSRKIISTYPNAHLVVSLVPPFVMSATPSMWLSSTLAHILTKLEPNWLASRLLAGLLVVIGAVSQVEAGPQDGTLLVTWQPVLRPPASGPVTGYAVYADGKKVTDVDSPTGDHALIDIGKLIGLNPKCVTVSMAVWSLIWLCERYVSK